MSAKLDRESAIAAERIILESLEALTATPTERTKFAADALCWLEEHEIVGAAMDECYLVACGQ